MKLPLGLRIRILVKAVITVLRRPKYVLVSVMSSLFMAGLIIWSLNLELLKFILLEAPLSLWEKVSFISYGYESIFTNLNSPLSMGILTFTVLFGINMALLVYVIRRHGFKAIPKKSGGGAFMFAILGGGCIACGTSLVAPLLASFGAVSAPFLRGLGTIFNWVGSILIVYSIVKLSLLVETKDLNKD